MAEGKERRRRADSVTPNRDSRERRSLTVLRGSEELWRLSSMTLRKGKIAFSFGRANRFQRKKEEATDIFGVLPSTLNPRSTSFGYGSRWTPMNPRGKDSPPPNSYDVAAGFDVKGQTGFSFGSRSRRQSRGEGPGPGAYEINVPLGKNAPKFTIRPKFQPTSENAGPPPDTYRPNSSFVQVSRYKDIGFGFGERSTPMNKAVKDFPGPGTYYYVPARATPLRTRRRQRGIRLSSPAELLATLSP